MRHLGEPTTPQGSWLEFTSYIADTITISGNGALVISSDPTKTSVPIPSAALGNELRLVSRAFLEAAGLQTSSVLPALKSAVHFARTGRLASTRF